MAQRVAQGVHRLGSSLVNFYLVEMDETCVLVDAGIGGYYEQVTGRIGDIEAVVLTHAHSDHVGVAGKVHDAGGAPIYVHEADLELARTAKPPKTEVGLRDLRHLARPAALGLFAHFARNGGVRAPKLSDAQPYPATLPAGLVAVPTPGHTAGHCVLHLPDRGVAFVGDALCSRNPLTGREGPQLMPTAFNVSTEQAEQSLAQIETLDADTLLFGHGDPWTSGAAAAVERARAAGPS